MMRIDRKMLYLWLVVFLLAGSGLAQPLQDYGESLNPLDSKADDRQMMALVPDSKGAPIEVLHSGRGFALKDNESHPLSLRIESLRPINPMHMRNLLTSNKSLAEIREALDTAEGDEKFDGGIKLDETFYSLVNIRISPNENSTELYVDLIEPVEPSLGDTISSDMATVGHLTLTIAFAGIDFVGKGELIMTSDLQVGSYRVFLNMLPPLQRKERD